MATKYTSDLREQTAFARLAYQKPAHDTDAMARRRATAMGHNLGTWGPPSYHGFTETPTYTAMAHCTRCGDHMMVVNPDRPSSLILDGKAAHDRCVVGASRGHTTTLTRSWRDAWQEADTARYAVLIACTALIAASVTLYVCRARHESAA